MSAKERRERKQRESVAATQLDALKTKARFDIERDRIRRDILKLRQEKEKLLQLAPDSPDVKAAIAEIGVREADLTQQVANSVVTTSDLTSMTATLGMQGKYSEVTARRKGVQTAMIKTLRSMPSKDIIERQKLEEQALRQELRHRMGYIADPSEMASGQRRPKEQASTEREKSRKRGKRVIIRRRIIRPEAIPVMPEIFPEAPLTEVEDVPDEPKKKTEEEETAELEARFRKLMQGSKHPIGEQQRKCLSSSHFWT